MADKLRAAIIGMGPRSRSLLELMAGISEMRIDTICDLDEDLTRQAETQLNTLGIYPRCVTDYRRIIADGQTDLVFVMTNWITHIPLVIDFLKAGIPTASEVCGAASVEECWELVRTQEQTGTPLMFLENCCYGRNEMMALRMAREGILGEIEYLEGAYCHDLRYALVNPARHRVQANLRRHGDLYPTHGIGILSKILNVNCGNRLVSIASMGSPARSMAGYLAAKHPDSPLARERFACEDVTVSLIRCANGELIVLKHSVLLPRPYSRGLLVQGTRGILSEERQGIHIEDEQDEEAWLPLEQAYARFDHPVWQQYQVQQSDVHGGMDYLVLHEFVRCVLEKRPTPIDVYDMAAWMSITALSAQSIELGGAVQPIPDFTCGKWAERQPVPLRG